MNKELEDRLADYHYKLKAADKRIAELEKDLLDNEECSQENLEIIRNQAKRIRFLNERIAELRDALRYCSGRMDNPRCPRCADVQQVAHEALDKDDEL